MTQQEDGVIIGPEIDFRLMLSPYKIKPYVGFHAGYAMFTDQWDEQGTPWGFTLGPFIGFKSGNWTFDVRYWHESNGTKVFNHNEGPNPGFNTTLISIGYEW